MTGTDLFPIKQDRYSGRLEMVYSAVMPKPGYHFEYDDNGIRTEVKDRIMAGYERELQEPHINPNPFQRIVGGCGGTQYGCAADGRTSRTKEEDEAYRKLATLPIVPPVILLPILQPTVEDAEKVAITEVCGIDNTFQEKLDTDTKEIADVARGALAGLTKGISKGIIVGVVVGIILIKLVK